MMTMYDSRTNLSRQVVEEVRRHFPNKVFRTIIPRNIRSERSPKLWPPYQSLLRAAVAGRGRLQVADDGTVEW
jgi:chromosome partitioning protein